MMMDKESGVDCDKAKISVIVPLYNKVSEIERALTSIFDQTIIPHEIIVIDGGSTDGSLEIVQKYAEEKSLQLIHQKSKGLPAARNEAIRFSHGDLLAFLDADDEWHSDFLETIQRLYLAYPHAGIYATAYERCVIDRCKNNVVRGLPSVCPWEGYIPSYFHMYVTAGYPPFCPCSVSLSRRVFDKIGFFNEGARVGEDLEMWMRVAINCRIVFTTNVCARYHLVASNKMTCEFKAFNNHPALAYLESLPLHSIKLRDDFQDVLNSIEYLKLVTAYFNIGAGNLSRSRELLSESTSTRYSLRRTFLKLLTYLPINVSRFIIHCYSQIPVYEYRLHNPFSGGHR